MPPPIQRINNLEALGIDFEYDAPYLEQDYPADIVQSSNDQAIVINGSTDVGAVAWAKYINVVPGYDGNMSPGQAELYAVLLDLQQNTMYTITTIGLLAKNLGLSHPFSLEKRMENLCHIGAISGYL